MVHILPHHHHMCYSAQSHLFKHTAHAPISQRCLHEMWICKQSPIQQHPSSLLPQTAPTRPLSSAISILPPLYYLAGGQMGARAAADNNETGGTNGCKSAPIINPHSFQRLNYEYSLARIFTNKSQIFAHFYPLFKMATCMPKNHPRANTRTFVGLNECGLLTVYKRGISNILHLFTCR